MSSHPGVADVGGLRGLQTKSEPPMIPVMSKALLFGGRTEFSEPGRAGASVVDVVLQPDSAFRRELILGHRPSCAVGFSIVR